MARDSGLRPFARHQCSERGFNEKERAKRPKFALPQQRIASLAEHRFRIRPQHGVTICIATRDRPLRHNAYGLVNATGLSTLSRRHQVTRNCIWATNETMGRTRVMAVMAA